MALSAAVRHSPYSIPQSSRFGQVAAYNHHANPGGIPGSSSYNVPPSSRFGLHSSMFNSAMSPLATCGAALQGSIPPAMNILPPVGVNSSSDAANSTSSGIGCLPDTSPPDHSPVRCCSESPTSPSLSVDDSPLQPTNPYKSCGAGCYSSLSPSSSLVGITSSHLNGSQSPPPLPGPANLAYPTASPAAMLPAPLYSSQDYSPASLSSSVPMPMWSPYPSLPNVGPLPSPSLPKLSYDSPRYKLTPERAIPLIKWFEEHKEHPYPTRHEKILLCQSTQLTFTQVSTWFANARRRMKKAISEEEDSSSNQGSVSGSDEYDGSPKSSL